MAALKEKPKSESAAAAGKGRSRKIFVETWGCQMNELDSRRFVGLLTRSGYGEANSADEADLVLLNTCSVRDKAEQKVYDYLGRMAARKRIRPDVILGVCGCVAQQEGEEILRRSPAVDFVLGTGRIELLPAIVRRVLEEGDRPVEVGFDLDEVVYTPAAMARNLMHRASITSSRAATRTAPSASCPRPGAGSEAGGSPRSSRSAGASPMPASSRSSSSARPSTPTRIRSPARIFPALLRGIAKVPGLRRLRFVTSHPKNFSDDLIAAMAESEVVCPALHLPFQSGSDRILRRMKRQYTRAEYLDLVGRLRADHLRTSPSRRTSSSAFRGRATTTSTTR